MIDATIEAPDKLDLVARALRDLGDKDLRRELYRGLNRVTTKLKEDAKAEAGRRLPRRGGLARRVAEAKLSTVRRGGRNPGVSIRARGMKQLAGMDAGTLRHPVWGHRDVWATQKIQGGWFTEPMEHGRDDVARAVNQVLDDLAVEIAHRL